MCLGGPFQAALIFGGNPTTCTTASDSFTGSGRVRKVLPCSLLSLRSNYNLQTLNQSCQKRAPQKSNNKKSNKTAGWHGTQPRIHQIHRSQPTFSTGARQGKCSVGQTSPAPSRNLGVQAVGMRRAPNFYQDFLLRR